MLLINIFHVGTYIGEQRLCACQNVAGILLNDEYETPLCTLKHHL